MADTFVWISACAWCIYFTHVYTNGLMPRVFFAFAHVLLRMCFCTCAFAHVCHTGVPFKLWVICTV